MTIEAQAAFTTKVQELCRKAKQTRDRATLAEIAALFGGDEFKALDPAPKINLQEAYRDAFGAVTGAGAA
jgi:hypothetical protein